VQQITPESGQRIDDRNLYAPLRTAAEAQQQTLHRGVWPLHSACNRNCVQGRMCDCVPALNDDEDADQHEGMGAIAVPFVIGVAALALFAVLAVVHLWSAA
jgi:hypothetical protein